jgi:hypothetical protein
MTVPTNKDELLKAIDTSFDKLLGDLHSVPLSMVHERTMEGHAQGAQMSVANLTAYLVGWNELVLKWLSLDRTGEAIAFPEVGFKWNDLGRLAQKFYGDYEGLPFPQLLDRLVSAKDRIVSEISVHSNDDLYGRPWYEKWTMGRMIQFNTASPYTNARGRLRKWMKGQDVT